jgi:hypothetical protein
VVRPPYSVVQRLVALAAEHWAAIDGEAAAGGADYFALSFDRFLNAVYWWAVQRVKDVERFIADLERPVAGQVSMSVTEQDLDRDAENFMAFANAMGVPTPRAVGPVNAGSDDDTPVPSVSGADPVSVES